MGSLGSLPSRWPCGGRSAEGCRRRRRLESLCRVGPQRARRRQSAESDPRRVASRRSRVRCSRASSKLGQVVAGWSQPEDRARRERRKAWPSRGEPGLVATRTSLDWRRLLDSSSEQNCAGTMSGSSPCPSPCPTAGVDSLSSMKTLSSRRCRSCAPASPGGWRSVASEGQAQGAWRSSWLVDCWRGTAQPRRGFAVREVSRGASRGRRGGRVEWHAGAATPGCPTEAWRVQGERVR